jgi:hypothetical protein
MIRPLWQSLCEAMLILARYVEFVSSIAYILILAFTNGGAFFGLQKGQTGKVVCVKTWEQHTCLLW